LFPEPGNRPVQIADHADSIAKLCGIASMAIIQENLEKSVIRGDPGRHPWRLPQGACGTICLPDTLAAATVKNYVHDCVAGNAGGCPHR
jgi:hypothetical protein